MIRVLHGWLFLAKMSLVQCNYPKVWCPVVVFLQYCLCVGFMSCFRLLQNAKEEKKTGIDPNRTSCSFFLLCINRFPLVLPKVFIVETETCTSFSNTVSNMKDKFVQLLLWPWLAGGSKCIGEHINFQILPPENCLLRIKCRYIIATLFGHGLGLESGHIFAWPLELHWYFLRERHTYITPVGARVISSDLRKAARDANLLLIGTVVKQVTWLPQI